MPKNLNITEESKQILKNGFKLLTSVITAAAIAVAFTGCNKDNKNEDSDVNTASSIVLTIDDGDGKFTNKSEGNYEYLYSIRDDNGELKGYYDFVKTNLSQKYTYCYYDIKTAMTKGFFSTKYFNIATIPSYYEINEEQKNVSNMIDDIVLLNNNAKIDMCCEYLTSLNYGDFAIVRENIEFKKDIPSSYFVSDKSIKSGDKIETTALYKLETKEGLKNVEKKDYIKYIQDNGKLIGYEQTGIGADCENISNMPIDDYLIALEDTVILDQNRTVNLEEANAIIQEYQMSSFNWDTGSYESPKVYSK